MRASAGLLVFRRRAGRVEVLIAHPGGPLWAKRDEGAWSVPKGEIEAGEEPLEAALREFSEELGLPPPPPPYLDLGTVVQRAGKEVHGWGAEGEVDPALMVAGTFEMEWPPRSGRRRTFPEIDRVAWFEPNEAMRRLNPAQGELVTRLLAKLAG